MTSRKFKGFACLALLCLLSVTGWSQAGIEVNGAVRNKDTNAKLSGVRVEVFQNGQPYDAVQTLGNGKYSLSLDHGFDYELRFSLDGLSDRMVQVETSTIPEDFQSKPFFLTVEMSLFEVPDGFDMALLEEPIGIVSFDARKQELGWDGDYTSQMQKRIQQALENAESGGDSEAAEAASNKVYSEHMRKAEVEFGRGRWEQSINWLERALTEVPGDSRAETMVEEAQTNLEKAEEEAVAAAEFDRFIREGKIKLKKKDWAGARGAIEGALDIKPDDAEAIELMAEVNAATAEPEEEEQEEESVEPAEPEEDLEAQAAEEEQRKRKAYDRLIDRADRDFDKQNYAAAKELYEEASELFPNEVYPFDRIAEAEERIVVLSLPGETEKQAEVQTEEAASDREYEDRVREGDVAFDAKNWPVAKSAYEAAQALRPSERYPKNRLRRLEGLMEEVTMDVDLEVDTEDLLSEDSERAALAAEEARLLAEEQQRLIEAEKSAAEDKEAQRRAESQRDSDAEIDRSRNYISARQNTVQDDAEAYYRNALLSEIRARAQGVELVADRNEDQLDLWTGNHTGRRGSSWMDIQSKTERDLEAERVSASRRTNRIVDLNTEVEVHQEYNQDKQAQANALRRDRMMTVDIKTEENAALLLDRTKRYAVFVDSLDRLLSGYAAFNQDLQKASVDARIMRYEGVQRKLKTHSVLGMGEAQRRMGNWVDIRAVERRDFQSKLSGEGELKVRAFGALQDVHSQYSGAPLTPSDFKDVKAKEGVRVGVEERSFEQGNALTVERTVRVDNEVNVYRKSVTKHGVYYFKNDKSITKDIWVLETFEISD